jgi:hypothetical protein
MDYRTNFDELISDKAAKILEIGPLHRPLAKKEKYPNVMYCDIRNTEQIKKLYSGNEYLSITNICIPIEDIVDIDIVLQDSYREIFKNNMGGGGGI